MLIKISRSKKLLLVTVLMASAFAQAQERRPTVPAPVSGTTPPAVPISAPRTGPKAYKDVITDKAVSRKGLFNIHKLDDKWFFEIGDTLLGRDLLVVNRLSKAAAGMRNFFFGYAGDQIGNTVIRFEKGPNNRMFLKKVSFDEMSKDSSQPMYRSVMNSNIQPIVASFDIAAYSRDSNGAVLDMTSFINSDNDILNFSSNLKSAFQVGSLQSDKSYTLGVKTYPLNVEVKTVKTYSKSSGPIAPGAPFSIPSGGTLLTMEINSSILLLPATPLRQRNYDNRVGYFARSYTDFDANPQGVKDVTMIVRWRLEPKDADIEKYKRGELVEPKKPIIYYIDPATPAKWVPYLIQGVNDWQVAFEKAGF
ncbi:MAG: DUF5117 domain-containing protein, partial [Gemmatimonadaceae bacterium]|nr:DUF5117 domain-containing protein [Chitinophagaceae bacterium]